MFILNWIFAFDKAVSTNKADSQVPGPEAVTEKSDD